MKNRTALSARTIVIAGVSSLVIVGVGYGATTMWHTKPSTVVQTVIIPSAPSPDHVAAGAPGSGGATTPSSGSVAPAPPASTPTPGISDWPTSVPQPSGTVQTNSGSSATHWQKTFLTQGSYTDVMAAIRNLYLSNGFTEPNPQSQPYFFENATFRIAIVAAARDHSASETNVNAILNRK